MNNTNIKAGDIVKVVNWGRNYSTYTDWFLEQADKLKPEWLVRYAYNDSRNYERYPKNHSDNRRWEVLSVVEDCALITQPDLFRPEVYLISLDGLSPLTREMTLSEIEAELGYPVKIIKEK